MRRLLPLFLVCAAFLGAGDAMAEAVKTDAAAPAPVRIAPSFDGHVGAWLLLGPFESASHGLKPAKGVKLPDPLAADPPKLVESTAQSPNAGSAAGGTHWSVVATNAGALDVKAALKTNPLASGSDLVAYAAGTLHLARAEKIIMLLGSDDGVRVSVDGKVVLLRDEARPQRDDDDNVVLDLAAGDHPILFKLHQRDGAWSFRVRFVDDKLSPPEGAYVELPGVDAANVEGLARQMSRGYASLDTRGDAYLVHLHARFTEGAPIGATLRVKAAATVAGGAAPLFEIDAGQATLESSDLDVQLPAIAGADLAAVEDKDLQVRAEIAGREIKQTFHPRKAIREAIKRADEIVARIGAGTRPPWLREDTLETVLNARYRLAGAQGRGDGDVEALTNETRELTTDLDALEHDKDPFATRTGGMRMAYRSPIDGVFAEYGLYVPPSYVPGTKRKYPLIVGLHGLNGRPLAMLRYVFGGDDPKRESDYEDRHFDPFVSQQKLEAFVVTPNGHGNTMYRDLGEDDPMRVLDRVMARYPIDENRVIDHRPVDGRHRRRVDPVSSPGSLRRGRAAVRLPQLLRAPRHHGSPDAPVGARPRRGALERRLGAQRLGPAALHRARHEGSPRREQRRPDRRLREDALFGRARAPRARSQRLADDVREPQGRQVARRQTPRSAPAARALPHRAFARRQELLGARERAHRAGRVGSGRRARRLEDANRRDDLERRRARVRSRSHAPRRQGRDDRHARRDDDRVRRWRRSRGAQRRRELGRGPREARRRVEARRGHGPDPGRLPRSALVRLGRVRSRRKRAQTRRSRARGRRSAPA